jgi:hypothetical protein
MKLRVPGAMFLFVLSCTAQAPAGRWDGTIAFGALKFPFTIHFEGSGTSFSGAFVNGDTRVPSTSGSFEGGVVRLSFGRLGTRLEAKLADGGLTGSYGSEEQELRPFTASAYCTCSFEGEAGPEIMGAWEVSDTGWRVAIRRKGEDTLATVSRPDGELGPLAGRFDGASFTLRYFDGTRAAVLEIEQRKDAELDLVWKEPGTGVKKYRAVRVEGQQ